MHVCIPVKWGHSVLHIMCLLLLLLLLLMLAWSSLYEIHCWMPSHLRVCGLVVLYWIASHPACLSCRVTNESEGIRRFAVTRSVHVLQLDWEHLNNKMLWDSKIFFLICPQLPSTWVSKSVRAPGRRTWLGSERWWAAGPCGGGTGSAGGGAWMWLPGPPCRPLSALLHPRRGRGPRGFRGRGVPSFHRHLRDF